MLRNLVEKTKSEGRENLLLRKQGWRQLPFAMQDFGDDALSATYVSGPDNLRPGGGGGDVVPRLATQVGS
jgi:hypothetical protein